MSGGTGQGRGDDHGIDRVIFGGLAVAIVVLAALVAAFGSIPILLTVVLAVIGLGLLGYVAHARGLLDRPTRAPARSDPSGWSTRADRSPGSDGAAHGTGPADREEPRSRPPVTGPPPGSGSPPPPARPSTPSDDDGPGPAARRFSSTAVPGRSIGGGRSAPSDPETGTGGTDVPRADDRAGADATSRGVSLDGSAESGGVDTGGAPVGGASTGSAPVGGASTGGALVGGASTGGALVGSASTSSTSTSDADASSPGGDSVVGARPDASASGGAASEGAASEGTASEGTAVDGTAVDGTAVDGTAVDGAAQEVAVRDMPVQTDTPEFRLLLSARLGWRALPAATASGHADPEQLARLSLHRRASEVTHRRSPADAELIQGYLAAALGAPEPDWGSQIETWATDVQVQVPPADVGRVADLAQLRQESAMWDRRLAHEREVRAYLAEALATPGSAVVWWLARHTDDVAQTLALVDDLTALSAATRDPGTPPLVAPRPTTAPGSPTPPGSPALPGSPNLPGSPTPPTGPAPGPPRDPSVAPRAASAGTSRRTDLPPRVPDALPHLVAGLFPDFTDDQRAAFVHDVAALADHHRRRREA